MLNNFLEHTRCAEGALSASLPGSLFRDSHSNQGGRVGIDEKIHTVSSLSDDEKFIAVLRRYAETDTLPIEALSDIDNMISVLRLEQYLDNALPTQNSGLKSLVRQAYYMMRPLFPVSFRKYLQRISLKGWDSIPFPAWPVDLTTENLFEASWQLLLRLQDAEEMPFIWFWPEGHSCACIMTHDVETEGGRDFCGTLMQMEQRHQIRSAFEVVPEQRYTVPDEFLAKIRDAGCEICIHGLNHDGQLFDSESIFLERAKKINEYAERWGALGFRSPVMYRNLAWLHSLNFSYDMSVPNVAHLDPQRGGCCTVMPYFIGNILELPLTTIQDYSLFNYLEQRSIDLWTKQIGMIREKHGLISFIIHPDYVNERWATNLYERLLDFLTDLRSNHKTWVALPREIDQWWRARNQMRLIEQNGTWKIIGPEAERARVAFVRREGRSIAYRIDNEITIASRELV